MSIMAEAVEVDGYALRPPAADWSYVIDGSGIAYRRGLVPQRLRAGWWPFAYADSDREHDYRRRDVPPVPPECGVAILRLSPDCRNYAWRNEYVLVGPDRKVPHLAHASAYLWAGERRTLRCGIALDLKAQTYTVEELPEDAPDEIRAQAEEKGRKLVAFLAAACLERDGDKPAPTTAVDLETERARQRTERIRTYCQEHGLSFKPFDWSDEHFMIDGERMSIVQVAIRYMPDLFGPQVTYA